MPGERSGFGIRRCQAAIIFSFVIGIASRKVCVGVFPKHQRPMWPRLIVFLDPGIQIGLQLVDRTIHLLAEGDTVELVEHRFVEALADAVGLRALGLGA